MASHIESASVQGAAGSDRHRMFAAAQEHVERQDYEMAVETFIDGVNDKPGTFQSLDDHIKKSMRDSARTLPLLFAARPPAVRAEL